jgi:hypothetical protein
LLPNARLKVLVFSGISNRIPTMKRFSFFLTLLFTLTALSVRAEAPSGKKTVKLSSGESMTGTVGPVRDGSLSLITEYGPVRIPIEKISPESKTLLGISGDANADALRTRIKELEDLVARLREENAKLRQGASTIQPLTGGAASGPSTAPHTSKAQPTESAGISYRISTTGKRHNSRCRYFNSAGRSCGANEGIACKVCGG